jgi:excisionase family DNA binding protein
MVVQMIQDDTLLTFKEAMSYLRVSRSTLYRLMWSSQLTGHKVGSTWRFYREDLRACVGREISMAPLHSSFLSSSTGTISTDVLPSVVTIPADTALSGAIN